jgi:hypothetical protein
MDYFYDGQIRRYVTQFMRIFIGFKYQASDGTQKTAPVLYGDMTRQVASIIKENSENKLPSVPRIACYITSIEMDTSRLSDPTFVSKVNIRERRYTEDEEGMRDYQQVQGGNYTVERLMPTPFKLSMKADIWTSNTDQKLQFFEQISVLFNPSLEIQTTDNFIDWTSLSVVNIKNLQFSSRTIPAGVDSEIDIMSMEFDMPIYISPPAKVKKLGVVRSVISNIFTEDGDLVDLGSLVYNEEKGNSTTTTGRYRVLLFKASTGQYNYELTLANPEQAIIDAGLDKQSKTGGAVDWNSFLEVEGGYNESSQVYFLQPSGYYMYGTFAINPTDPSILAVSFEDDPGTIPTNTDIASIVNGLHARGTVDAIIDPYKHNPAGVYNGQANIPLGLRYLMLDDVNTSAIREEGFMKYGTGTTDSTKVPYDGPDGWKNLNGSDPLILANSIIEWNGSAWVTVWNPADGGIPTYIQNLRTGIQYRWDGEQWLKSFEGEYAPGTWGFRLNNC